MKWNHDYTMRLSIGYSTAVQTEIVNPSLNSSYSEDEWNALTEEEQQAWLDEELNDWSLRHIETSVTE